MKKAGQAIAMISGGLDSTLALAMVQAQGVEVKAINFYTGFCITETQRRKGGRQDGTMPQNEALRAAADLQVEIEYIDISGDAYLDMLLHPKYGYGANANPCVDCRIFMMKRAKEVMEREGADFIFTGEVLGQRPKSQRRDTLWAIERESGLKGRLVRPLSAKLLPPSIPELEGILDRSKLGDLNGRGRTRQIAMARELGLVEWPQPAGGCCFLTDESFARKFFDILGQREAAGEPRRIDRDDVVLMTTGRHFRLSPTVKLIVGRTEVENGTLESYAGDTRARLAVRVHAGPLALVEGVATWEERQLAARILARYGKGKDQPLVEVEWRDPDGAVEVLEVAPELDEARVEQLRI
jgi:tRNA U34 2-thiouridine synthase MnmA/TrmU